MNAISTASAGLSSAFDRLDRTALAVATQPITGNGTPDPAPTPGTTSDPAVKAVLDLASEKEAVEANAAVLRTGTRLSSNLVDILV